MSFKIVSILFFCSTLSVEANTLNILTGDKKISPQEINRVLKNNHEKFKYHLEIIQPGFKMDPKIVKKIKNMDKYKIIAIDPTNKKIKRRLTKKLNTELDFSLNAPTLEDLTKIPGLEI